MPSLGQKLIVNDSTTSISRDNFFRPLTVRMSNGWIVVACSYSNTNISQIKFYVSKDNGATFSEQFYIDHLTSMAEPLYVRGFDMVAWENRLVFVLGLRDYYHYTQVNMFDIDMTTVTGRLTANNSVTISSRSSRYMDKLSMSLSKNGDNAMVVWKSRSLSYTVADNIYYVNVSISPQRNITTNGVGQLTFETSSDSELKNPSITRNEADEPVVGFGYYFYGGVTKLRSSIYKDNTWSPIKDVVFLPQGGYRINEVQLAFIPSRLNGLPKGRIVGVYHGTDISVSTDSVFYVYSDDGGVTWSNRAKIAGKDLDTYSTNNTSLSIDRDANIYVFYISSGAAYYRKCVNDSWSNAVLVRNPADVISSLSDINMKVVTPPAVHASVSGSVVSVYLSGNFNYGATISPKGYSIGKKSTPNVLTYTVEKETGSTITKVTELINGAVSKVYTNPTQTSLSCTVESGLWEGTKYWVDSILEIRVEDSNNVVSSEQYRVNKSIVGNESTSKLITSIVDAKDNIHEKKEIIVSELGLPPNSNLDDVISHLKTVGSVGRYEKGLLKDVTFTISGSNNYTLEVSNLDFHPAKIHVYIFDGWRTKTHNAVYSTIFSRFEKNKVTGTTEYIRPEVVVNNNEFYGSPTYKWYQVADASNVVMFNGGFKIPIIRNASSTQVVIGSPGYQYDVLWEAYEY